MNKTTTAKTFKSRRAAQLAMTKAEKAYVAAIAEDRAALSNWVATPCNVPERVEAADARRNAALVGIKLACEHAQAIYSQAFKQGFFVRSWHFGCNPTRDLIAANID
jgi:hypothetical protein